eukprot:s2118_g11.t1
MSHPKALTWLKKETVIRVGRDFRSVGGRHAVSIQVLNGCYDRMSSWVRIAVKNVKSEWPTFEAARAFSVFQLKPRLSAAVIKQDLTKLCTIFDDSVQDLVQNFIDSEYTAAKKRFVLARDRIVDTEPLADLKAWLETLRTDSCKSLVHGDDNNQSLRARLLASSACIPKKECLTHAEGDPVENPCNDAKRTRLEGGGDSTPTFVWGDKNKKNEHLLKSLKGMGAVLTDCWQQASVHIVDDVAKPGQRVSWSARLGGHLLATPRWEMVRGYSPFFACQSCWCCWCSLV